MVSDTLHPTALPGGGGNPVIEQVTGLPPVDVHDFSVVGPAALSAVKTAPLGRGPTVPFTARMPPASTAMVGSAAVVGVVDVVDVVDGAAMLSSARPLPVFNGVMGAPTPSALGVDAVATSVGVAGAVVGVLAARGAAVPGVVGVVVVAVDGGAVGVGAPAGDGAARDRVPIAKPVTSATQTWDSPALRPWLSRRRR